jgi:hypothetical protein
MALTVLLIGIIIPVMIQGWTIYNLLYWTIVEIPAFVAATTSAMYWVYIFGTWFLCKSYLDIQADFLIEKLEEFASQETNLFDVRKALAIYRFYTRLVNRIKQFDDLSRDLISPYRLTVSVFCGALVFGAHQTDMALMTIGIDTVVIFVYVISLTFLSTASSLSNRRRKMYFMTNRLFVNVSSKGKRNIANLRSLFILRQLIKSLGSDDSPTICLTEQSGGEFDSMEFVNFVADTFSNFTLVVNLYYAYVK